MATSITDQYKKLKREHYALIFSLVFHVIFFAVKWSNDHNGHVSKIPRKLIKISLADPMQLQELKKAQKKVRQVPRNQIVNTEITGKEARPDTNRFLGAKNQVQDRQSIASRVGKFKTAGKGERTAKAIKKGSPEKVSKSNKKVSLSDFGLGSASTFSKIKENDLKSKGNALDVSGLKNGVEGKTGLAQNNDFIEDVPLGDFTKLNTVEFKFYGYYHRIRQKLEQYWGNSLKMKTESMYRKGRTIARDANLVTSLAIRIDSKGQIVNVEVQGTSGVKELDDAAIESFNKAGPFPNPPKDMLDKYGKAVIKWGFVVKS